MCAVNKPGKSQKEKENSPFRVGKDAAWVSGPEAGSIRPGFKGSGVGREIKLKKRSEMTMHSKKPKILIQEHSRMFLTGVSKD
jgi:hypothetical protein